MSINSVVALPASGSLPQFVNPNQFVHPVTTTRQTAHKLHVHGANVLPCRCEVDNKKPVVEEWKKWEVELQSVEDVERMPWSQADISVAVVSGVQSWRCIDVDAIKEPPTEVPTNVVDELLAALGLPVDYPWVERSLSFLGWHVWFRCTRELPNGEQKWDNDANDKYATSFKHMELRWRNHYTVLCPQQDMYQRVPSEPPAVVQVETVVDAFHKFTTPLKSMDYSPSTRQGQQLSGSAVNAEGSVVPRVVRNYQQAYEGLVPEGRRNAVLTSLVGLELRQRGLTGKSDEAIVAAGLYWNSAHCSPPMEDKEVERTVRGILHRYGEVNPADRAPYWNDNELAHRFVGLYGEHVRWNADDKVWMIYVNGLWVEDGRRESFQQALDTIEHQVVYLASIPDKDDRAVFLRGFNKYQNHGLVESVLAMAGKNESSIITLNKDYNPDARFVNLRNGVLDTRTLELLMHEPRYMHTKQMDVELDPLAECPKWEAFLDLIVQHDRGCVRLLQQMAGLMLTGRNDAQIQPFLYGPTGANGKTTFTTVLLRIYGSYAMSAPMNLLASADRAPDGNAATPALAALKDILFVPVSEVSDKQYLNVPLINVLTGGEPIRARNLHGNFFEFDSRAIFWMFGNTKPRVADSAGGGIWRRVKEVPFNYQFPEGARRPLEEVVQEFLAEGSGILNWMIRGLVDYRTNGLVEPQAVVDAVQAYRVDSDTVARFIDDRFVVVGVPEVEHLTHSVVEAQYVEWCTSQALLPMKLRRLADALAARGLRTEVESTGQKRRLWIGLRLKNEQKTKLGSTGVNLQDFSHTRVLEKITAVDPSSPQNPKNGENVPKTAGGSRGVNKHSSSHVRAVVKPLAEDPHLPPESQNGENEANSQAEDFEYSADGQHAVRVEDAQEFLLVGGEWVEVVEDYSPPES